MLRTHLALLEQEIRTMQSEFSRIDGQWSDRVSVFIEKNFQQEILIPCHDYHSRMGSLISEIEGLEAEIVRISAKYHSY